MKRVARLVLIAIIGASQFQFANAKDKSSTTSDQTFTGIVSDSMCGATHMTKDAAQCTRECEKSGSDYALVVGDKVYTLKGNKAEIDKLAGERATVKGKLRGDTITVDSITGNKQ